MTTQDLAIQRVTTAQKLMDELLHIRVAYLAIDDGLTIACNPLGGEMVTDLLYSIKADTSGLGDVLTELLVHRAKVIAAELEKLGVDIDVLELLDLPDFVLAKEVG